MDGANKQISEIVAEKLKANQGVIVPIKASVLERCFKKKTSSDKLHPNPGDEFCFPNVGPSYEIIADYERKFRQYGTMIHDIYDEPLIVEKVHPSGYMILNGHHRWVAAMRVGIKHIPISIINLTQETDIQQMISQSKHDKRVTLDLDEVVFCTEESVPAEKPLGFPYSRVYKEKIRLGIPALLHFLGQQGYDVWVYTAKYYSMEYIRNYFKRYSVKMDGIITGTARKAKERAEARKRTEKLFAAKYKETIHIDNDMILRSFTGAADYEECEINEQNDGWSNTVMEVIKGLKNNES